jgi:eukaryotic-like serine/threonine-protein kinase
MISATSVIRSNPHPGTGAAGTAVAKPSRYRLVEIVGEGGMGVVHLAKDVAAGELRAVKVMRPEAAEDPASLARFHREAETIQRFAHPNIVAFIESGPIVGGSPWFVMEYVPGQDLDTAVREEGPLAVGYVVEVIRAACAALEEVHAHGIVHSDIKPANLIVPANDRRGIGAKLIDFGLARPINESDDEPLEVDDRSFSGSPLYAPPESYGGTIDYRSDIYSLGATAFHLLAGRPVFDEQRPLAAIMAHVHKTPEAIQSLRSDVPAAVEAIVMRCLEKDPQLRFQSVEELDAALADL